MNTFIYEFFSASILMGLAIGLDAAIATGVNAQGLQQKSRSICWIVGITLTHTLFPMIGYLMSYYGLQQFPVVTPLIGIAAFYLIAHFLVTEYRKMLDFSDSENTEHDSGYLISLGLILAVSWDALWSGPAKSAQVIEWPPLAVWTSFLVVGATVAILSTLAFIISTRIVISERLNRQHSHLFSQWLQLSAISYFGLLALCRYTFGSDIAPFTLMAIASSSTAIILITLHKISLVSAQQSLSH
mgnify:CR=1 FL=1